MERIILY